MIKQLYWQLRTRLNRRLNPTDTVLSPHDWFDAIARHLTPEDDRIVLIDGGAHDGVWARTFVQRMESSAGKGRRVEVHAFEPNTDLWPRLEANLRGVAGSRHALALASSSGESQMNINASPMTSSMLPRGAFAVRYFDEVTRPVSSRPVWTVSLDDWRARSGVDRVDVLKLDLQGFEVEALRGASAMLRRGVRCVYTEVSFVPLYEGQPLFGDVDTLMRQHGYRLYNLYHLATKRRDGQLNGADALYIPDQPAAAHQLRLCTGDAA
jgi:FkbM family methyltransferase